MKILKFGGSSVKSPEKIRDVKNIIENQTEKLVVVVSAFQGITNNLVELSRLASEKDNAYKETLEHIKKIHIDFTRELIEKSKLQQVLQQVTALLSELENISAGVFLLNDLTPKIMDRILSFGERLSAYIISNVITNGEYADSRDFIKTDNSFGNAKVYTEQSYPLIAGFFKGKDNTFVVPGFISSTVHNETTTLGRGGSDYTAALFAAALHAKLLEIWTDVDGFMTADPRKVSKAFAIESLSYPEAMELSHFGAKVIYTPTIQPVYKLNIPIVIKNTYNPDAAGTYITREAKSVGKSLIKGISSIDDINLITLQGPGMVGVKGISMRMFGALANSNINIILITQASSEYSISLAINPEDIEKAITALENEFEPEIKLRNEVVIQVEKELSIIAIVGEQMKNTPGISATLFRSLGRNGISVIATAQGSSELNISVVIKKESLRKAMNVIHEGFFLSHYKELHIYLVGIGTVGGILLQQIYQQQEKLMKEHQLKVNVVGISNSRKMLINPDGINIFNFREQLDNSGTEANLSKFIATIKKLNLRNSVFIDCTASQQTAAAYKQVLESFISIVAANKIACSSDYSVYKELKSAALSKNVKFMYETNVGAGLPIISTINDLIRSGDKILKLEAVLSGTLNFIFNELGSTVSMSKAIRLAKEKGFSEPDPRIDLSGTDVVRKLLILARESGYPLEYNDIKVEPFLPSECFEGNLVDFWKKVEKYDQQFETNRQNLEKEGKKWRFVALLDEGKARVSLQEVDKSHPAFPLEGSNNILLITTERYRDQPMIIRGYGAGAEVTAAGVFADTIRVANV
ncbi:MAG: bifunctional aspartate kinase/homoserine dehydrogenase I [Bacteroidales bacterium]|nr:bifunctional aspartate kinase/homoserine dehydrogenase I [Bacteroidales bacterium]